MSAAHQPAATRGRRDRGATLTLITLALPVLLLMTSFAVDLGRQRALRRDLQADADVIALDLVRLADGRTRSEIEADPGFLGYVNGSFARNGVDTVASLTDLAGVVTYGTWDPLTGGPFIAAAPGGVPNAVELVFTKSQENLFRPGSGGATRRAVAIREGIGSFSIGSRLASLDTTRSALLSGVLDLLAHGPDVDGVGASSPVLLGGQAATRRADAPSQQPSLGLDALSYEGLIGSDVAINELLGLIQADLADGGAAVGSPEEVLASDIALASLIRASADALDASGGGAEVVAAAAFLDQLALAVDPDLSVNLADLLGIDVSQPGAVLDLAVNAFDLVTLGAQAANRDHLLGGGFQLPPGLFDGIPGLQDVLDPTAEITLSIIESPRIGTGAPNDPDAFAETSQIRLGIRVGATLQIDASAVPGASLGEVVTVELDLPLSVDVGSARTQLVGLVCSDTAPGLLDLDTSTNAALIRLGTLTPGDELVDIGATGPVQPGQIALVSLLGADVATVRAGAEASVGAIEHTLIDDLPVGQSDSVEGGQLGFQNLLTSSVDVDLLPRSLLGSILNPITDAIVGGLVDAVVAAAITPLLVAIDGLVVAPLLSVLGAGVAGADVSAIDAICDSPKLTE